MKHWRSAVIVAGIFMASVVLIVIFARHPEVPFSFGNPLPPGRVAPKLINTWDRAVLLAPDGSLWSWGGTAFPLTGLSGGATRSAIPKSLGSAGGWRDVTASHVHVVALKFSGTLWGLGWNGTGQLAQPSPTNQFSQFVLIDANTNWAAISGGLAHTLALKQDGSLWAWGQNDRGQVGDGTRSNKFVVTQIGSERDWQTICAGAFNSFALKRDGTVWGWGLDPVTSGTNDSLVPALLDAGSNWVALSAGDYCVLGLKADGTLWLRGQNAHQILPEDVLGSTAAFVQVGKENDWKEIYAGQGYFFARKTDGSWWVCGQNQNGELGFRSTGGAVALQRWDAEMEPWAFAPGYGTTLLLAKDGTLWSWGSRLGTVGGKRMLGFILRLFGRSTLTAAREDHSPYRLWQLPSEVAGPSPGTGNAPFKTN
jgi:alpha-tubulin suppressor-like RCC1 family protein